jgi:hypothetical protein
MTDLLDAAMRVCDLYDDSAQARADMRVDVLATPAHLQSDLLDHFSSLLRGCAEPVEAEGRVEV